jgi:hypothetical protein
MLLDSNYIPSNFVRFIMIIEVASAAHIPLQTTEYQSWPLREETLDTAVANVACQCNYA